ncbi:hypothetical protein ACQP2U_33005 [Nocardia sp. CA-084685]|uniref:hypothetical protein n=1 Tax=Nocardia sp. CA-084685 TaxID=3239970 RepID=UPI003D984386
MLFELVDALVEGVDVGGCAEPRFAPGLFAEGFGQAFLEVLDSGVEPGGSFVGGEQVRLQRGAGDRRPGVVTDRWICLQRMDFLQAVAVPVEEGAVDSGGARDRGRADLLAVGRGPVEPGQDALASAN